MKSAVEWLIGEISKDRVGQAIIKTFLKEFEQAKEMEKQRIIDAYHEGSFAQMRYLDDDEYANAEQYYNETFKNKI
jgi:hypothetical protein